MKSQSIQRKILNEFERLIIHSCNDPKGSEFKELHIALLKKSYNAAEVIIDYRRKRIAMDIVSDDTVYDPKKINMHLPTFRTSMPFKSLCAFLKTCIAKDRASLAFYASILQSRKNRKTTLVVA